MEHYETNFFTNYTQPRCEIVTFDDFNILVIKDFNSYGHGKITLYFDSEHKLIEFINSVKSAYENFRKEKGYDRGK